MYPTGSLPVHLNGSAPQHARLSPSIYAHEWNPYTMSPNEATSNSTFMMTNGYPQNCTLSPFPMQSRTPLSLPQLSPTSSDISLSPSYAASHLSTPTTPGTPQSFMPSPTLSQQKSQVLDVCHTYLLISIY